MSDARREAREAERGIGYLGEPVDDVDRHRDDRPKGPRDGTGLSNDLSATGHRHTIAGLEVSCSVLDADRPYHARPVPSCLGSGHRPDRDRPERLRRRIRPARCKRRPADRDSTVDDIATLDFARVDQVNGPIAVDGARQPGTRSRSTFSTSTGRLGLDGEHPGLRAACRRVPGPGLPRDPRPGASGSAPSSCPASTSRSCRSAASSAWPRRRDRARRSRPISTAGTWTPATSPPAPRCSCRSSIAGARFSIGDGHAAQGDGEVCGTAIETPMVATVRLTVAARPPPARAGVPHGPRSRARPPVGRATRPTASARSARRRPRRHSTDDRLARTRARRCRAGRLHAVQRRRSTCGSARSSTCRTTSSRRTARCRSSSRRPVRRCQARRSDGAGASPP